MSGVADADVACSGTANGAGAIGAEGKLGFRFDDGEETLFFFSLCCLCLQVTYFILKPLKVLNWEDLFTHFELGSPDLSKR